MSTDTLIRSAQLRHALRTPLNQIAGYSDMLLEDLAPAAFPQARSNLELIRENGRLILDLLRQELPTDQPDIGQQQLQSLRRSITGPLETIAASIGALAAYPSTHESGMNLADVLRIGAAVAELIDFATGARDLPSVEEPTRGTSVAAQSAATGDVLAVDDNPGNCDLLARMLERHGYRVWTAHGGAAALAQLDRQRFDLVLLDLMMPVMDGIEVLRRMKDEPQWRFIPVIMLTALDETSRVIQCLEFGAEDYLVKPFDPVLLLARLRSTLERSRLRAVETSRARELEAAYDKLRDNEHRLQESEERLRLATDAAGVGIWYFYPHQDRVLMTPGCKRLFGLPVTEEVFNFADLRERIHPEDRDRADAEARGALNGQSEYDTEYRVNMPDGSVRWLSSRGLAQTQGASHELRLAGVAMDITGRKQAEEAMLQAHKLESIGLLAGGIAHDFNNLLTGIIGSTSFVIDNLPDRDPNAEMLRNVMNAGERAADLTKQLLAYSGKGKFSVQRLDLSKLVSDIAVLLRASISRSVALERKLDSSLPPIEGDATQIQQILMNLVINGSEAITGEGAVRVSTGLIRLGTDQREAFVLNEDIAPGDYVCLEVCDTGAGMDRELLNKIFEPFFTTKFTGRGLGLSAVFGIVRGHEGALEVRTTPGKGTTFRIYFPPATGERAGADDAVVASAILFVDKESVVRLVGKTALERAGFRVFTAEAESDSLETLVKHGEEISTAVVDLRSDWSGWESYRRLKQAKPSLPILLSTVYDKAEVEERFPGEYSGPVLQKPYSPAHLLQCIREMLVQEGG